jgi:hypothetical protein
MRGARKAEADQKNRRLSIYLAPLWTICLLPVWRMSVMIFLLGRTHAGLPITCMLWCSVLVSNLPGHDRTCRSLIIPFTVRSTGGRTPAITSSQLTGSRDEVEVNASEMTESRSRKVQVQVKKDCLVRDGNRCVISGGYDIQAAEKLSARWLRRVRTTSTEAAHIIPFSLRTFTDSTVSRYTS